jgi:DNA polymerase I-like protein with 3'-5' exonuclease and polymerase domains
MLGVDFSSVENITNAIEANDWDRVQDVLAKKITHEGTAELVNKTFGLSLSRAQGKNINHGFDKGESPYNLARTLFKSDRPSRQQVLQCQNIYTAMLKQYPKSAEFRLNLWERAKENPLVVANSFGRKLMCFSRAKYGDANDRFAKHDESKKYWCSCSECGPRRDRWKYAIAFLGRSAAFDALLQKMQVMWYEKRLDEYSLPYLEVHDELDFSVPREKVEHYAKIAKLTFEEPIPELGGVCLPASVVWGNNWSEAH